MAPLLDKESRKMFIGNIIKFIIGWILLVICFVYLGNHPAEKASVVSGFEVLYQKARILTHKVFYDDADVLEKKFNMEKVYKELIRTAEDSKCVDVHILEEVTNKYHELKKLKGDELQNMLPDYTRLVYKYNSQINEIDCD